MREREKVNEREREKPTHQFFKIKCSENNGVIELSTIGKDSCNLKSSNDTRAIVVDSRTSFNGVIVCTEEKDVIPVRKTSIPARKDSDDICSLVC